MTGSLIHFAPTALRTGNSPDVLKPWVSGSTIKSDHQERSTTQELEPWKNSPPFSITSAYLVAALAGGISLVMFGFAGIQYMTAQGDPQGMSKAKDVSHWSCGRSGHRRPGVRHARDHQQAHR